MYIETSPQGLGDHAKLNSPLLTFRGNMCLKFFYHMYGLTIGQLNVLINGTKTVFSASGNKGNNWLEARITTSLTGIYMVRAIWWLVVRSNAVLIYFSSLKTLQSL